MLALLYIVLIITFGSSLVMLCVDTSSIYNTICGEYSKKLLKSLFIVPTGTIIGILLINFTNYYSIYIFNNLFPKIRDLSYPICFTLTFIIYTLFTIYNFKKIKKEKINYNKKNTIFYICSIIIVLIITTFLMFYTYRMNGNNLLVGATTSSDMSPHTAMTSSFGVGGNIPTSYMHFANDGIRYHFFFYFFTGSLKYLGMPIDLALNIPSIIVMLCSFILVGLLANMICKKKIAFIITPMLILFRSSLNFFYLIKDCITSNSSIINTITHLNIWYKVTPYDDWGIWAINVYPNQRHLMLGVAIILILVLLFIPLVKNLFDNLKKFHGLKKIKYFLFSKKTWLFTNNDKFIIIATIIVICSPYFHGSALIGALLVIFGMALISEKRLLYLLIAFLAIVSATIQTKILSGGANNLINFIFKPGFVVDDKSLFGITQYLFIVTGFSIIIAFIYTIIKYKKQKYLLPLAICFTFPLIFAFLFQITMEMLANHKFIQFTIILLNIFVASFLAELFSRKSKYSLNIVAGIIISFTLTITGITEWFSYINMNRYPANINVEAKFVTWIKENTAKTDIFLTPMWSMHEFYLSGRAAYMGWPYYAWSAGHDTYKRDNEYEQLLIAMNDDIDKFINFCKANKIKYLIDNPEYTIYEFHSNNYYHQKYLQSNLKLVADFSDENIKIYQIYD